MCPRVYASVPPAKRLWANVGKVLPSGCKLWLGHVNKKGYGKLTIRKGESVMVHRFAWELYHGCSPGHLRVMHSCDNPRCVARKHLSLGTIADNNADRHRKGGYAKGEHHTNSRLTDAKVREARQRSAAGESGHSIAEDMGISKTSIQRAINRQTWRHVI